MVNDQRLTPFWPVDACREKDLYFWLEAIEAYLPDSRVRVSGHGNLYMLGGYSYLGKRLVNPNGGVGARSWILDG
jgi:hypothetical protein